MTNKINAFLKIEQDLREAIVIRKSYVDMAGDLIAGLLLSQIVFWHIPDRDGNNKIRVERENQKWLAKKRTDWWEEIRITPKQYDRAIKLLIDNGFVVVKNYKFNGVPVPHIRIVWNKIIAEGGKWILTKGENGLSPKVKMDFDQRGKSITEDTTEITPESIYNTQNDKKNQKTDKTQSYEEDVEGFFRSVQRQDWWDDFILAFPNVTTKGELTRAKIWLLANKQKRKKNFKRFLYNWLSKAQDRYDRARMYKGGGVYGRRSAVEAIGERLDIASQKGEGRKDRQDDEKDSQPDICKHNPLVTGTFGDGTPIAGPF